MANIYNKTKFGDPDDVIATKTKQRTSFVGMEKQTIRRGKGKVQLENTIFRKYWKIKIIHL